MKEKIAIINATIVRPDHLIPNGTIVIEDGIIRDFGKKIDVTGMKTIDAAGAYVGPGLIDIHTHAGDGRFFSDDPVHAAKFVLKHGVTSVLPALYFGFTLEQYLEAIAKIDAAVAAGQFPNFGGYYMEGPYTNPKFGCERDKNPWRGAIDPDKYMPILEATKNTARVYCLAPERENIEQYVQDVKALNPKAVFSVAHSEAEPDQIEALMPYGLKLGTHHTNATGTLEKYPECRGVCVDETVNYNREIFAELICDSVGIHVAPYNLRLIRKIKGDDRIILISDTYVCDGPIPDGYEGVTDINFDHAGEIAGSNLTLDIACRNFMVHTGCSVCDAFRFASYNPAKLLGLRDLGEIKVGNRANLIMVDAWFGVQKVILNGAEV